MDTKRVVATLIHVTFSPVDSDYPFVVLLNGAPVSASSSADHAEKTAAWHRALGAAAEVREIVYTDFGYMLLSTTE
jgi:hypothetical protein